MKKRIFFGSMLSLFLIEFAVLLLFALPKEEKLYDTVEINEVVQTVQRDWDSLGEHSNLHHLNMLFLIYTEAFCTGQKPG